jgi:hypothetical protein
MLGRFQAVQLVENIPQVKWAKNSRFGRYKGCDPAKGILIFCRPLLMALGLLMVFGLMRRR